MHRTPNRCVVAGESQTMMAQERHAESDQPAGDIRHQRPPRALIDQRDDDRPVHRRRDAADEHETRDALSRGGGRHDADKHSRPRSICICVDDFGFDARINDAALHLASIGRAQAITCQVGGRAWTPAAIDPLRRLSARHLDVGLHLDFTEYPLRAASRRSLPRLLAGSLLHRLDARQVRAEIQAQLDAFEDAIGRPPRFVDGHQHVHQLPTIRSELVDELQHRYDLGALWLRSSRHATPLAARGLDGWRAALKACGISLLGATQMSRLAAVAGIAQNHRLLGIYGFEGGAPRYREWLEHWLRHAADADLLMCHPATAQAPGLAWSAARVAEWRVLSGDGLGRLLAELQIGLAPLSGILGLRTAT